MTRDYKDEWTNDDLDAELQAVWDACDERGKSAMDALKAYIEGLHSTIEALKTYIPVPVPVKEEFADVTKAMDDEGQGVS